MAFWSKSKTKTAYNAASKTATCVLNAVNPCAEITLEMPKSAKILEDSMEVRMACLVNINGMWLFNETADRSNPKAVVWYLVIFKNINTTIATNGDAVYKCKMLTENQYLSEKPKIYMIEIPYKEEENVVPQFMVYAANTAIAEFNKQFLGDQNEHA